ncbi:hypothetical protein OIU79_011772 [Salix purpurea]|uniref:Uncharacterized protein n=1 Tax=Salix purpurea TaxID=77065 RepID=A0A9Q0Q269_SALPP|nr:hypothetical protein OIU79_011772 [Salix purpurea]
MIVWLVLRIFQSFESVLHNKRKTYHSVPWRE